MADDELSRTTARMARHIEDASDDIVEAWIDWLKTGTRIRTTRPLSHEALRNHIPPVLRSVAAYVREPLTVSHSEMLGHLRLHASIRRQQGYSLPELLAEFDGLAHLVTQKVLALLRTLDRDTAASPTASTEAFCRVSTGLRAISFVTVDAFREHEQKHREELSDQLEDFARTIAHEIRTPLHTLALGLATLRRQPGQPRAEQLDVMERALDRASDLLDDVRQLALVESGRARDEDLQPLRILHEKVLTETTQLASRVGVELEAQPAPDIHVDGLALQLSLSNVIGNAIKYSDPDEDPRTVEVSYEVRGESDGRDRLVVTVRDNGLGIAEPYIDHVFERHLRAHPEAAEGTGLGLAITRQVLSERGGSIEVQSEAGVGSEFTFVLPCYDGESIRSGSSRPRSVVSLAVRAEPSGFGLPPATDLLADEARAAEE